MSLPTPDIEKLRAMIAEATQLPWHVDNYNCYVWGPNGEMVADSRVGEAHRECPEETGEPIARARGMGGGLPIAKNMALVVAAVNALPALLDSLPSPVSVPEGDARAYAAAVNLAMTFDRMPTHNWRLRLKDAVEAALLSAGRRARREGREEMRELAAKRAEIAASRMFPRPRNRITAENAGHTAARLIRELPLSSPEEG